MFTIPANFYVKFFFLNMPVDSGRYQHPIHHKRCHPGLVSDHCPPTPRGPGGVSFAPWPWISIHGIFILPVWDATRPVDLCVHYEYYSSSICSRLCRHLKNPVREWVFGGWRRLQKVSNAYNFVIVTVHASILDRIRPECDRP